ncbi:MAG: Mut7-C ubiquitin/RNAse domain-containing protein [Gammaproteobacteria bacterium]|nr:Mut7-C ubiquitin/RNAse domain-containing protein [Gammaproteobacteria bacterium]MDH3465751.1 Mut7-C ubiquitin/RNAse domain-containing protein [Gammaproteobacteria bacterium]
MAHFRFYEELNDFLPSIQRKRVIDYRFGGAPAIKDPIEALGIPHTEVDLIIVNGQSVDFAHPLCDGDRVAVYPMFECFDITPLVKLRDRPLRRTAFILDVNLGKLARRLRMLGFDADYANSYNDREVVELSVKQHRIILTRDRRLLFHKAVTHGYWVRAVDPPRQLREVLARFDLYRQITPFHRCLECNGVVQEVPKEQVEADLEPLTRRYYDEFFRCGQCRKIYWKGSHFHRMCLEIEELRQGLTRISHEEFGP